ncbi:MAG: hypothetical protein ACTH1D_01870 [Mycobacteriaceae bacterium]|uniref:hypothetical protein n=1 Tax=Corynebacterium sp. TaxID=1720 RepID=UPI003F9C8AAB
MTPTTTVMRFPWQRLQADRPLSTTFVMLLLALPLALLTQSMMVQFDNDWAPLPSMVGGLLCPALAVLLVVVNPVRYRGHGLSMRGWLIDHAIVVAIVAVIHLIWPVWLLIRPTDNVDPESWWVPVMPMLGLALAVLASLWRYRYILAGRVTGTDRTFTGTPWYMRLFRTRRGPVAWRVAYQPLGLVALLGFLVSLLWQWTSSEVDRAMGIMLFAGLVSAPVVAVSRETSIAVGMPRRRWLLHALAAIAIPLSVLGVGTVLVLSAPDLPGELQQMVNSVPEDPYPATHLALFALGTVLIAVASAALSLGVSYEAWGPAVMWFIVFWVILSMANNLYFSGADALAPSFISLGLILLITGALVFYARTKSLVGSPTWIMTSIIDSARRTAAN